MAPNIDLKKAPFLALPQPATFWLIDLKISSTGFNWPDLSWKSLIDNPASFKAAAAPFVGLVNDTITLRKPVPAWLPSTPALDNIPKAADVCSMSQPACLAGAET